MVLRHTQAPKPPSPSEVPSTPFPPWWNFRHDTALEGCMLFRKCVLAFRCRIVYVFGQFWGFGEDWGPVWKPYSDPIAIISLVARLTILV